MFITYDAIGNPLAYRDGMDFTWEGHQLKTAAANGQNASYAYDDSGIRTSKVVNGATTYYLTENGRILAQRNGAEVMWFLYDSDGTLVGFTSGDTAYYYAKNSQGDITGIFGKDVDGKYKLLVEYNYDAWGKILSVTGPQADTIGVQNPFRYRGYYYDNETGFYYLNSRYYDPQTGRFINADSELSTGSDLTSYNLFAYCGNDPVNRVDPEGHAWWHWAIAAAVVTVAAAAVIVTAGGAAPALMAVSLVGNGFAAATTASTIEAGAFIGAATGLGFAAAGALATSSSAQEFANQGNWGTVAVTAGGAALGAVAGYVNSPQTSTKSTVASPQITPPKFPGNDPTKCEVGGFEWKGSGLPISGKGNFVNSQTGEWLHPDLNHGPPIGPHWDYGIRGVSETFRIFPDNSFGPK